jgi:hypothetical protein
MQRRLRVLEGKIVTAQPCAHPLPLVWNDQQADEMMETLNACPKCSTASGFRWRVLVLRYPAGEVGLHH